MRYPNLGLIATAAAAAILVPAAAMPAPVAQLPISAVERQVDNSASTSPLSWARPWLLRAERESAGSALAEVDRLLSGALSAGVPESELAPRRDLAARLRKDLNASRQAQAARAVGERARALGAELRVVEASEHRDRQALQATAASLAGSDPAQMARQAQLNAAVARNELTVLGFLGITAGGDSDRLERYAQMAPAQPALADAGTSLYRSRVHELFQKSLPAKVIVVSIADQRLTAFERGQAVVDTVVTTGRPELPTDIGPMRVLRRDSPWKMHSPWPKSSPYYYPDETVREVLWFTETGEGLHDAPWRARFGPGSNVVDGSHGCINLPDRAEDQIFTWAEVGTPVIVYPGDGAPVAQQLAQRSVDQNGVPRDGARGA